MRLSIVIPVFNAAVGDVLRCLNSVFLNTVGVCSTDFEVICVDDCSTVHEGIEAISNYTVEGVHPENLRLIHHKENRRQGGARNTGVSHASGDYIRYLDHDDLLPDGALKDMMDAILQYDGLDLVAFDFVRGDESGNVVGEVAYSDRLHSRVVSGGEFMQTQEVPWLPCIYLYRRMYLLEMGNEFVEGVRFEDVDYVLRAVMYAKKMVYLPKVVLIYTINSSQTSTVGNSPEKIRDCHLLCYRIGLLAEEAVSRGIAGSKEIVDHYIFSVRNYLKSYVWRLPYRMIHALMRDYPPNRSLPISGYLRWVGNNPRLFAMVTACVGPFMQLAYRLYRFRS